MTTRTLRFFSALIVILVLASCAGKKHQTQNKNGFELKGKLDFSNGEQLYLEEMGPQGVRVVDTANVNANGEFSFENYTPSFGFYRLRISDANFAVLVLDSAQKVVVGGDARNLGNLFTVEGSEDSRLFVKVNNSIRTSYQKRDSVTRYYQALANLNKNDKGKIQHLADEAEMAYRAQAKALNNYLIGIVSQNAASLVAVVALQQLSPELSNDGYLSLYRQVDQAFEKKHPGALQTKLFHENVESMYKTVIGAPAPEFLFESPDGKRTGPSSFKGKVLLLDFWASWCHPCREESPNMVKLYKKYHSKGLEILGVSLDKDKDKWEAAISADKLDWSHVSDLGEWQSKAVKLYSISSIPYTYLIDKEGVIVAKGLRADSLDLRLAKLLK